MTRHPWLIVLTILLAACASGGGTKPMTQGGDTGAVVGAATTPTRNRDVIGAEELADPSVAASDLYQAVQRLRPSFFRTRGKTSLLNDTAGQTMAAIDGNLQELTVLHTLRPGDVKQVSFLSETDAAVRFGRNANGGAVIVVVRK